MTITMNEAITIMCKKCKEYNTCKGDGCCSKKTLEEIAELDADQRSEKIGEISIHFPRTNPPLKV